MPKLLFLGLALLIGCKWTQTTSSTSTEEHPSRRSAAEATPTLQEEFPRYTPVVKVGTAQMVEHSVKQFFGDAAGIRTSCHALFGREVLTSFFSSSPNLACARMTLSPEQTRARIDQAHRHEQVTAWGQDAVLSAGFAVDSADGGFYLTLYLFPAEGVIVAQAP
ncbi:hypothetical protein [Deinococcus aestuarii]|uniref:hypothetical protein n=1 Tax=Deinococcus aestuarii TaxID=2774531 RepID=UPI001C0C84B5|nr:hypothetical protein [Deinococcus aestuarii]